MAGRGMGAATRGGGAVTSGPRNKMLSKTSDKTGPVLMKSGGLVNQHKRMAMGKGYPTSLNGSGRDPAPTPAKPDANYKAVPKMKTEKVKGK